LEYNTIVKRYFDGMKTEADKAKFVGTAVEDFSLGDRKITLVVDNNPNFKTPLQQATQKVADHPYAVAATAASIAVATGVVLACPAYTEEGLQHFASACSNEIQATAISFFS
ncbi:hypothetical protein N9Y92_04045, partial [Chlamydiales bacterium]|nr:hypothetical protein [Chlamydiales bacterium]